jgi:hypothetical protein
LVSSFRVYVDNTRLDDDAWRAKLAKDHDLGVPAWARE